MKRSLLFSFCGMLVMMLWAIVFGTVSGGLFHIIARIVNPDLERSAIADVLLSVKMIVPPALPMGSFFGGVSLLIPQRFNDFRQLAVVCVICSAIGAPLLGLIGSSIAITLSLTTSQFQGDPAPAYIYGLLPGWILGFFVGFLYGLVAGTRRLRKADLPAKIRTDIPPISAP